MIVAMQDAATEVQIQDVIEHLVRMGFSVHRTTGARQTVLAAVGARMISIPAISKFLAVSKKYTVLAPPTSFPDAVSVQKAPSSNSQTD